MLSIAKADGIVLGCGKLKGSDGESGTLAQRLQVLKD